ncbi:MAG: FHA domain-containing protein [Actinobacteria bacterium]|nr:FHA domain-containing protein [Actinomycetota bacterium]
MPDYLLEIVEGPDAGRRIVLAGSEPVEIGRVVGLGIRLAADDLVSLHHARVTPIADGAMVEDLDSRNGTFVNGERIHAPAPLQQGGQLLVGVTLFELRDAEPGGAGGRAVPTIPPHLAALGPFPTPQPEVPPLPDLRRGRQLDPLLEVHTMRKATGVPLAVFVLVALAAMILLALR